MSDINNQLVHIITAIAYINNATACMANATHYLGIGATYIAIVTTNMTNAAHYISIALFQTAGSVLDFC